VKRGKLTVTFSGNETCQLFEIYFLEFPFWEARLELHWISVLYSAHGTHQVQDVFMKFASIIKAIAASNSRNTRGRQNRAPQGRSLGSEEARPFRLPYFVPFCAQPPLFLTGKHREECGRVMRSQQVKTTLKLDDGAP
jgi:hypothetical protein